MGRHSKAKSLVAGCRGIALEIRRNHRRVAAAAQIAGGICAALMGDGHHPDAQAVATLAVEVLEQIEGRLCHLPGLEESTCVQRRHAQP